VCRGARGAFRRRVTPTPVGRGARLVAKRPRSPRRPPRDAFSRRRTTDRVCRRVSNLDSDDACEEVPHSATGYLSTARESARPPRAFESRARPSAAARPLAVRPGPASATRSGVRKATTSSASDVRISREKTSSAKTLSRVRDGLFPV
jgi:hypothetical protein